MIHEFLQWFFFKDIVVHPMTLVGDTFIVVWLTSLYHLSKRKKAARAILTIMDSKDDERRPCKGRNVNVCVAEGCYGEACLKLSGGKDER